MWQPVINVRFDCGDRPRRLCPKRRSRLKDHLRQPGRGFSWVGVSGWVRAIESCSDKSPSQPVIVHPRIVLGRGDLPVPQRPSHEVQVAGLPDSRVAKVWRRECTEKGRVIPASLSHQAKFSWIWHPPNRFRDLDRISSKSGPVLASAALSRR